MVKFLGIEKVWSTFLDLRFTIKIQNCKFRFLKIWIFIFSLEKAYNIADKLLQLVIWLEPLKIHANLFQIMIVIVRAIQRLTDDPSFDPVLCWDPWK